MASSRQRVEVSIIGRVSCNAGRSRARAVRKASRRVNSTEHEVNQKRSLIHVSKTKEIAHLRGISAGKTRASGVRGEPGSTAWRLPGGRRSHDTRMVRRRIPLAMPLRFLSCYPPIIKTSRPCGVHFTLQENSLTARTLQAAHAHCKMHTATLDVEINCER